ncbi:hypothetical protein [Caldithrix abyssi]
MNTLPLIHKIRKVFLLMLVVLLAGACDVYQHQSYTISAFDQKACQAITENTVDSLFTANLEEINPAWSDTLVTPTLINALRDSLTIRGQSVVDQETAYLIVPYSTFNDVYFTFNSSADQVVLFVDNSVDIQVWKNDGTQLFPDQTSIPLETIASCPTIITRAEFSGVKGETLLQVRRNDQTKKDVFHLVILKK